MTQLEDNLHYMNPFTGSVQTGSDWHYDQETEGWPESDLHSLIEVFKSEDGWEEVK